MRFAHHCVQNRVQSLRQIIRQYRNLKMLSRAARFLKPGGADATSEGELAVVCPACPHAGVNIPSNFKQAPKDMA